ncbi:MAG: TetR family transcriptional regulator [Clostridia bacterium]
MEDLRVQRTYLLLKNALLELLAKKSFDEIKVNDICNLAMIHRTTFYSHFQDKYDLLEYCVKNIEQELTEKINTTQYSNSKEFYTNLVMSLLEYISENKKMFKSVLKNNFDNSVNKIFMNTCINYITDMLKKKKIKVFTIKPKFLLLLNFMLELLYQLLYGG